MNTQIVSYMSLMRIKRALDSSGRYSQKSSPLYTDGLLFHDMTELDDKKRTYCQILWGPTVCCHKNFTEATLALKKDGCRIVEERGWIRMVFTKNHQKLQLKPSKIVVMAA